MRFLLFLLFPVALLAQTTDATTTTAIANKVTGKSYSASGMTTVLTDLNSGKVSRIENYSTSGTNTYTVSIGWVTAYTSGLMVPNVKFGNANTGAATININSLGAISLKKNVSTALASGDIPAGKAFDLYYDGTNFQIKNFASISSGITNSAPANYLMLSDGTNAIDAGVQINTSGVISILKASSISGYTAMAGLGAVAFESEIPNNSNTMDVPIRASHYNSSPSAGIGVCIDYATSTTAGASIGGQAGVISTNIGSGTESYDYVIKTINAGGSLSERFRAKSTGTIISQTDFLSDNSSNGMIVKSPNGHYWRITVSNGGVLSTTDIGTSIP